MAEPYYFDISYRKTPDGQLGLARRADMDGVIDWLQKAAGRIHMVMIIRMPGELPDLQDKEV